MNVVREVLPEANIVHDKYHVMKYIAEAVDGVRKAEHKALMREGVYSLKGTKYLWLTNPDKWTEQQKAEYRKLCRLDLKVARACVLRDMFGRIWGYRYVGAARNLFTKWYWLATHSRMKPMVEVANVMKRHLEGILTYLMHGITNAVAEALNGRIQQIKAAARGFRNFDNFRVAILFHLGKLNLYPHQSR